MDNESNFFGFDENSEIYKLLKLLENSKEETDNFELNENEGGSLLGEPIETNKISRGDFDIIINVWSLDDEGKIKTVKIINKGDEELTNEKMVKLINSVDELSDFETEFISDKVDSNETLNDLLDKAVKNEDFMLAAQIRDEKNVRDVIIEEKITLVNSAMAKGEFEVANDILTEIKDIKNREFKPLDDLM